MPSSQRYDNANLGTFQIRGYGSYNWSTLPVKQAPYYCYNGVLYQLAE
jgi:hypothetical protein